MRNIIFQAESVMITNGLMTQTGKSLRTGCDEKNENNCRIEMFLHYNTFILTQEIMITRKALMTETKNQGSGLAGVIAGESAISMVGQHDAGLRYRGYNISELASKSSFEEVAFLLIYGELP